MIRTVLFDVDDTLLDFRASVAFSLKEGLSRHSITYEDGMLPVFLSINDGLWHCLEKGEITREELFRVRFKKIFDALGIALDGPSFEREFGALLFRSAVPFPGAKELLRTLYGKVKICAASNASHRQQLERLRIAGLLPYMEEVYTSELLGCEKPERAFFEECLRRCGAAGPREVLMVGDSVRSDIAGAASVGIRTCLFSPDGSRAKDPSAADTVITELSQLLPLYEKEFFIGEHI